MTNIKEVIHLYLGCEAYIFPVNTYSDGWLSKQLKKLPDLQYSIEITTSSLQGIIADGYAPILRRLDSMTDDEAIELTKPVVIYGDLPNVRTYETYRNHFGKIVVSWGAGLREKYLPQDETAFTVEQFAYLLKQGFWLFGDESFEQGLIIDKNFKP